MRKLWPLLAALVVLTSACRLDASLTVVIEEDGSGTFTTELGRNEQMQDLLDQFFGGIDDLLETLGLNEDGAAETRTEGDMTYVSVVRPFADTAELTSVVEQSPDQASFDTFELSVTEEGARVVAQTPALASGLGFDLDSLPFDVSSLDADAEVFSANVFVKMPGTVGEHNADEVLADGTLRWGISLTDPIDIAADSTFGGGGVSWLPIGGAAVAILGIGAFLATRKKDDKSSVALSSTEAPPAPMDFSAPTGELERPPEAPPAES